MHINSMKNNMMNFIMINQFIKCHESWRNSCSIIYIRQIHEILFFLSKVLLAQQQKINTEAPMPALM